ncbi:thiol-disulfide oxidoreductase DCC family protein [Demequina sediminicola]|uniref:thiol-disulfide oxidoreductase DCC family protein n=1 Tax=Demequina sediminicola TaxID=1095026 RepID=UPI0013792A55|nr:DCC1-like thiol-disulfide oxidoreductase family protein [Demequina sediminicola]
MATSPRPIVIFDGDCGLCNGFVAWLIRHDPHEQFTITGSAGDVGRAALAAMGLPQDIAASTLVIATAQGPLTQSDAVLGVARRLGWPWKVLGAGAIVPRTWRNGLYNSVAARRSRRPAEDSACGTPPPDLVRSWRRRLATFDNVKQLTGGESDTTDATAPS